MKNSKINELIQININNDTQWVLIKGDSIENPIILFLHGGPGFSQMFFAQFLHKDLEKRFLVVNWDQRNSGKSYSLKNITTNCTFETYIEDTITVTK